jgi:hypothetical protein
MGERVTSHGHRLASESPIEQLIAAVDRLDIDAVMGLLAPMRAS